MWLWCMEHLRLIKETQSTSHGTALSPLTTKNISTDAALEYMAVSKVM